MNRFCIIASWNLVARQLKYISVRRYWGGGNGGHVDGGTGPVREVRAMECAGTPLPVDSYRTCYIQLALFKSLSLLVPWQRLIYLLIYLPSKFQSCFFFASFGRWLVASWNVIIVCSPRTRIQQWICWIWSFLSFGFNLKLFLLRYWFVIQIAGRGVLTKLE